MRCLRVVFCSILHRYGSLHRRGWPPVFPILQFICPHLSISPSEVQLFRVGLGKGGHRKITATLTSVNILTTAVCALCLEPWCSALMFNSLVLRTTCSSFLNELNDNNDTEVRAANWAAGTWMVASTEQYGVVHNRPHAHTDKHGETHTGRDQLIAPAMYS